MVVLIIEQISIQREFYTFDYKWGGGGGGGGGGFLHWPVRWLRARLERSCVKNAPWEFGGTVLGDEIGHSFPRNFATS